MKRLPCSVLVPFLVAACAEGRTPAPQAPAAATRPSIAATPHGVESSNPRTLHTEDIDEYHLRMLALAQLQFETFIRKAGNDPRFAEAVKRSREHIDDIEKTREFVAAGLAERRTER